MIMTLIALVTTTFFIYISYSLKRHNDGTHEWLTVKKFPSLSSPIDEIIFTKYFLCNFIFFKKKKLNFKTFTFFFSKNVIR